MPSRVPDNEKQCEHEITLDVAALMRFGETRLALRCDRSLHPSLDRWHSAHWTVECVETGGPVTLGLTWREE